MRLLNLSMGERPLSTGRRAAVVFGYRGGVASGQETGISTGKQLRPADCCG
jgi:hypothetical protein